MDTILKTMVLWILIIAISSCCEQEIDAATLTINFIGYNQSELDSLIILDSKPDSIINLITYDNLIREFNQTDDFQFQYYFFENPPFEDLYIYDKITMSLDSITNINVKYISGGSSCGSGPDWHKLAFIFRNVEYELSEHHTIAIEK